MQRPTASHLDRQSKRPPRQAASEAPRRRHGIVKLKGHDDHPWKVFAAPISRSFGSPLGIPNRGPQGTLNGGSKCNPPGVFQGCLLEALTNKPQESQRPPIEARLGAGGRPSEAPLQFFFAGGGYVFLRRRPYFFGPKTKI